MNQVKIPLTIELSEAAYKRILEQVEGEGEDAQKISMFANEVFDGISRGAMLLSPATAERLCDIDERMADSDALIEAVERGLGVSEGAMVGRWKIDPSLHEEMRQRADVQGMTVDQMIQEMMDQAMALGWFWDLESRCSTFFLNREQYAQLSEVAGEPFSTDVLMRWLGPKIEVPGPVMSTLEPHPITADSFFPKDSEVITINPSSDNPSATEEEDDLAFIGD
jgi:hypothetical protein